MARHAMLQRTLVKVPPNHHSTFLYFPTPLKSLPRPAEVLQSPTKTDSWGKACGKLAEGCGDYSWGRPAEACEGLWKLLLEKARGKLARGRGDYSWRTSAEACEGLRRLLLGEAWGKLAKWREGCEVARTGRETWREDCEVARSGESGGRRTTYCPRKTAATFRESGGRRNTYCNRPGKTVENLHGDSESLGEILPDPAKPHRNPARA